MAAFSESDVGCFFKKINLLNKQANTKYVKDLKFTCVLTFSILCHQLGTGFMNLICY